MLHNTEQKKVVNTIETKGTFVTVRADSMRWTVMVNVDASQTHKAQTFVLERNPELLYELSEALNMVADKMREWEENG